MPLNKILLIADTQNEEHLVSQIREFDSGTEIFTINGSNNTEQLDFENFEQLAIDAKSLGISTVFLNTTNYRQSNPFEIFLNYGFEIYGAEPQILNLQTSKIYMKEFLSNTNIKFPKTLNLFAPIFPEVLRKNTCEQKSRILISQADKEKSFIEFGNDFFVEEYISGKEFEILAYYDNNKLLCSNYIFEEILKQLENKLISQNTKSKFFITIKLIIKADSKEPYIIGFNLTDNINLETILSKV